MKHTWCEFHSIRPALHNVSQTNEKIHPIIFFFLQRKIFDTKFGKFFTIQKRFEHNWIKNSIAVRVYFWALFANLDFPNSLLAPYCTGRLGYAITSKNDTYIYVPSRYFVSKEKYFNNFQLIIFYKNE